MRQLWFFFLANALWLLSSCTASPASSSVSPLPTALPSPATLPIDTSTPTHIELTPTRVLLPSATTTPAFELCTPLQGISLDQIPNAIVNPFHPPHLGSDDPHQGVDLADLYPGSQIARPGMPVLAVMDGRVAMVTADRFPFGNSILIETPLDMIHNDWLDRLQLPGPIATLVPDSPQRAPLNCPDGGLKNAALADKRSLYLLYAHLLDQPGMNPGDRVTCGQVIETVGKSGNALNPHLHFEIKVGPAGIRFNSMAHYDASASLDEMANYCIWSISGLFQVIDPLKVLSSGK
jgi:murein DD-endopeptidase MepM/ murein hydrolase activator NlpD